jgi:hypothetical protein
MNTLPLPEVQHHLEPARAAEADPWAEGVPDWVE